MNSPKPTIAMPDQKSFNRVLIIDDDYTSQYISISLIEDMAITKDIITANNGKEGLDKIQQSCDLSPDKDDHCLILLDINMPIMNGFEFIEHLKKIGKAFLVEDRIIVLTSSTNKHDKTKMQNYGVSRYLEKPISQEKLLPLLEAM
jgi:CheY-like chemotaxis protein